MPTALPIPERRLSWAETVRFLGLVARVRWLDRRLHTAHARVDRLGLDVGGDHLLRLARRWLACHEAIGGLLGMPEPPHVAQVRIALGRPSQSGDSPGR